jgi:hypothetical protein
LAPIQNFFPPDVLKLLEPAADAESVCAFENKTGAVIHMQFLGGKMLQ